MIAKITVTLKPGLLDAQGKTMKAALESIGFHGLEAVRMGKYIEVELKGLSASAAKAAAERMAQQVLSNPVIENYHVEIDGAPAGGAMRSAAAKSSKPRKPARTRR